MVVIDLLSYSVFSTSQTTDNWGRSIDCYYCKSYCCRGRCQFLLEIKPLKDFIQKISNFCDIVLNYDFFCILLDQILQRIVKHSGFNEITILYFLVSPGVSQGYSYINSEK